MQFITGTLHPLLQVPRLTAVLRALATDHGAVFDADAAFIQRQKVLKQRQQEQSKVGSSAAGQHAGRSQLAQQLLGDWNKGVYVFGCAGAGTQTCQLTCPSPVQVLLLAKAWTVSPVPAAGPNRSPWQQFLKQHVHLRL